MRARAATAVGIISFATAVSATGSAIINNQCSHDVYLWPVSADESAGSPTVIKSGGNWSQQYKSISSGGMSLKLSDNDDMSSGITQFEYTLAGGMIWYDISNVNCLPFGLGTCPFQATGMHLSGGSGCPTAVCQGGADTCHDAYTYPKDDWASLSCQPSTDTTLNLCSSESGGSSGSSSGNNDANGIIGQVNSAVGAVAGAVLGGGDSSTPTTSVAPTTSSPPPAPTTTSQEAKPTHHWSPPVAEVSSESQAAVAVAAVPSSSSVAPVVAPPPVSKETPTEPSPATTLATSVVTQAPVQPNVAVVYETVTTMVSTTVVYQHKMFHKEKRGGSAHPHARRHHHE